MRVVLSAACMLATVPAVRAEPPILPPAIVGANVVTATVTVDAVDQQKHFDTEQLGDEGVVRHTGAFAILVSK